MEPNLQTSFIPKKPMVQERATSRWSVGFFTVVSFFIFLTVLLATAGLYLYKASLAKNIIKMESDLNLVKKRFEPSKITELKVFDRRLQASTEILGKHIAITPVFEALSAITMKTVRYTKFNYDIDAEGKVIIKMNGQAVGYRSIALQSDLFTTKDEGKNFIDPVFSNLTLNDKGNVLFDLEFSVNPDFVNYKSMLQAKELEEELMVEEELSPT